MVVNVQIQKRAREVGISYDKMLESPGVYRHSDDSYSQLRWVTTNHGSFRIDLSNNVVEGIKDTLQYAWANDKFILTNDIVTVTFN